MNVALSENFTSFPRDTALGSSKALKYWKYYNWHGDCLFRCR
jgi:hypothetical protein